MRVSAREMLGRLLTGLVLVCFVGSLTIYPGCGPQGQEGESEQAEPETPQAEKPLSAADAAAAERPAFLDVLAAATPADSPLPPGQPLPELEVEGWINGQPSTTAGSPGSILVVECWAYW
jgi:hypothetical protein